MLPSERRAAGSLAAIFGLRMLGMFLILPVFALYAEGLTDDHALIGLTLGAYGLSQALLMIPFGMASDRFGRKPVILFGLAIFALGSFWAAAATDIYGILAGRILQGAGAVSAAVTALLADLTREEKRTQAMAMIGSTIGLSFAFSLAAGPLFYQWIGVPGMFAMTGVLAILAMPVLHFVTPNPGHTVFHSDAETRRDRLGAVFAQRDLLQLDWGIFALHAAQMAMFTVIPFALTQTGGWSGGLSGGFPGDAHWQVYLPVVLISFVLMVPAIIVAEKRGQMKPVFVAAIVLMLAAQLWMTQSLDHFWGIVTALLLYFIAFNILEAMLPSLVSKIAPPEAKGTAMGVYNTAQALGLFFGGAAGGWLASRYGWAAAFWFASGLIAVWLLLAMRMTPPPRVRTQSFHIGPLDDAEARHLASQLAVFTGIEAVTVLAEEQAVLLKVSQLGWDEEGVRHLLAAHGG